MRVVLGCTSLLLSMACMGCLVMWAWQAAALAAFVSMRGGVNTKWSISDAGWLLIVSLLTGSLVFLCVGLSLIKPKARGADA